MKQYFKKLCVVMMVCMLVVSLVGCAKTEPTSNESDVTAVPEPTEAAEVTQEAESTPEPTPEPTYDFGGRVLKIGSYYDMTPDPESSALKEAFAERIKFVEENYNCKIEFVAIPDDYTAAYITSVLAGDPIVDIGYVMSYKLLPSLIEGGIAYPVSDLGVFNFDDYKWRPDYVEAGNYKGKNYSFLMKDPEVRYGIFWNKTLFEQYGLPDLYELYENGEWTWDKFKEIAIAGNQDLDNDGTIDIYGFNERESIEWCYIYSNGATVANKTDSGMELDLSDNKVVEALTALQDFKTTVTHQSGWLGAWDDQIKNFRDGKAMMSLEEFWISYAYLHEMPDDFGFVPFPKGPSATDWSCYGKEVAPRFMLNGIEDPEEAALIYDLITDIVETDEEWDDLMEAQLEAWADDAETVEITMDLFNRGLININPIKGFNDLSTTVNTMFGEITSGTSTPQTALETYQSQIDAALNDISNYDYDAEMQAYLTPPEEEEPQE
jgi:multiple sugar transport system substrate-binding protein